MSTSVSCPSAMLTRCVNRASRCDTLRYCVCLRLISRNAYGYFPAYCKKQAPKCLPFHNRCPVKYFDNKGFNQTYQETV